MNAKKDLQTLWSYLSEGFEPEELEPAMEEFEFDAASVTPEAIEAMNEEAAAQLLFDLAYMAVNGLFGGDFHTWNDVLESLGFDEETLDYLNY